MPIEQVTLKGAELAFAQKRAAAGDAFMQTMLENQKEKGSLTKKQHATVKKAMTEWNALPTVAGKKVRNQIKRDGKPVCRACPSTGPDSRLATKVVGDFGYCEPEHAATAESELAAAGAPA